ncbi:MAG: outer membrane beta-barrel protein, partial [Flavicella sp.]|nr:outer membrane beta-barrel protein [Flavicella sp.]
MKKLFLFLLMIPALSFAQLGVKAGFSSGKAKVSGGGVSVDTESSTAISIGLLYDAEISENLDLLPSIAFAIGEKVGDEANNAIGLGLQLQYYVSGKDNGFFIGPGLGLGFTLADIDTDLIRKTTLSGGLGVGYDITDNITLGAAYSAQLNNASKIDGVKIRGNAFSAELQYKF